MGDDGTHSSVDGFLLRENVFEDSSKFIISLDATGLVARVSLTVARVSLTLKHTARHVC